MTYRQSLPCSTHGLLQYVCPSEPQNSMTYIGHISGHCRLVARFLPESFDVGGGVFVGTVVASEALHGP